MNKSKPAAKKKPVSKAKASAKAAAKPPKLIDARIKELGDWRGAMLARIRNITRAIDWHKGEKVNATAFKALIRAAVALNKSRA